MTKEIKQFLRKLQWKGWVTEISDLYHNRGCLENLDDILKYEDSLYFISFIPSYKRKRIQENGTPWRRTKEEYVIWKSYVVADFDIRSSVYKRENGRVLSNEELMAYLPKIEEGLKSDESLSSYNAIVFSGNWFHVYWIGQPVYISADLYSKATTAIYDRIAKIFKDVPELQPDYATWNISRLMRLPGTLNKKEKYWLPPIEVKLLYFDKNNDSPLIGKLKTIWEWADAEEKKRIESELKKAKEFEPSRREGQSIFEHRDWYSVINEDIKISTLVCKYTGWRLAENGKNFISTTNWGYTGAYVIPEENVVVRMWTPHFSDYYKVYSPFSFIMVHYADGDAKRTFQVAKELFPTLHIVSEQYLWCLLPKDIQYGSK